MFLEDPPDELIRETQKHFNIASDKSAFLRINDSLSELDQKRFKRIAEGEKALKELSRQQNTLSSQHAETTSTHSSSSHAAKIVELDTQKFRIAKAASDLEIESERLEVELDNLKSRLQELEMQGIEGDEAARMRHEQHDPTLLRLKIYRCLGIDAERDEAGNFSKAIIRNNSKGDVHVVNIDPRFSKYFYADFFWSKM